MPSDFELQLWFSVSFEYYLSDLLFRFTQTLRSVKSFLYRIASVAGYYLAYYYLPIFAPLGFTGNIVSLLVSTISRCHFFIGWKPQRWNIDKVTRQVVFMLVHGPGCQTKTSLMFSFYFNFNINVLANNNQEI